MHGSVTRNNKQCPTSIRRAKPGHRTMASNKSNAFDRFRFIKPGAPRPASNKTNDDAKPKARPSSSSSPSSGKTAAAAPEPPRKKARIEDEDDEVDDSDSFGARDLELPAYSLSDDDDEDYSEPAVPEPETAEPEPPSRVGPQQWADFVRPISWKPHGDLSFQILECEDAARDRVGSGAVQGDNSPLIRLFGITADGYSVTAFVKGFYPFLLFPVTRKFDVAKGLYWERAYGKALSPGSSFGVLFRQMDRSSRRQWNKRIARLRFIPSQNWKRILCCECEAVV